MGPVISVFLGMVCGEVIFAALIRTIVPRLPLPEIWKARAWRWSIAVAIVYGLLMIIVMLTMGQS